MDRAVLELLTEAGEVVRQLANLSALVAKRQAELDRALAEAGRRVEALVSLTARIGALVSPTDDGPEGVL